MKIPSPLCYKVTKFHNKYNVNLNLTYYHTSRPLMTLRKRPFDNIVGKGENNHYEQFLLLPQCFQKACSQGRQKVSLCGNGVITVDDLAV